MRHGQLTEGKLKLLQLSNDNPSCADMATQSRLSLLLGGRREHVNSEILKIISIIS
jgi:hypothetical protein